MLPVTLLFARSASCLRRAWLDALFTEEGVEAPVGFRIVTGASTSNRAVLRTFLETHPGGAVFVPEIEPLGRLLEDLAMRTGGGLAPLPPLSHALVAEDLVRSEASSLPWLASLARRAPIGTALAEFDQAVACAGKPAFRLLEDSRRRAELTSFLERLAMRLEALPGHRPLPFLLRRTQKVLDGPVAPTAGLLGNRQVVLVLDPSDLPPLQLDVFVALVRAWARTEVRVIIALSCGTAADLWETDALFGTESDTPAALRARVLSPQRSTRRRLFEEFVSSGEGKIWLAGPLGLTEVEGGTSPPEEPFDLVDHASSGEPLSEGDALPAGLDLCRCPDEHAELRAIVRGVKEALGNGLSPEDCLVALADLPDRTSELQALARDHGVPLRLAQGSSLASCPLVATVLAVVDLARSEPDADALLSLLEDDLVSCPPPLHPRRMRRELRAAGADGPSPASWRESLASLIRRRHVERSRSGPPDPVELAADIARFHAEIDVMEEVLRGLAPLAAPATPDEYRYRVLETAERLRIPYRAGRLPVLGDREELSAHLVPYEDAVTGEALAAWGAFVAAVDEITLAAALVRPERWPAAELADLYQQEISKRAFAPPHGATSVVAVVPVEAVPFPPPRRIWVGGLSQGVFPAREGDSYLFSGEIQARLQPVDKTSRARFMLARLVRESDAGAGVRVTLSWPATRGGRLAPPSPLLTDYLSLGCTFGEDPASWPTVSSLAWSADFPSGKPRSLRDLARLAAVDPAWYPLLPPPRRSAWEWQAVQHASRSDPSGFGPFEGVLGRPVDLPPALPLTTLEGYLHCPAAYFFGRVLRLAPEELFDPDLPPSRRGLAIHRVLERFLSQRLGRPLEGLGGEAYAEARRALRELLDVAVDEERDAGFAHPRLLEHQARRWGAGLCDDGPAGLLKTWLDCEVAREWGAVPSGVEIGFGGFELGAARVSGKVDRIDVFDAGAAEAAFVVIDYKTGRAPAKDQLSRGLLLQPVVYGEAMARRREQAPWASVYQEVRRPGEVAWRTWHGETGLVARCAPAAVAQRASTPEDGARLLDHAARATSRMAQGVFHVTLLDPVDAHCATCDFRRICRWDEARVVEAAAGPGDWQRPLEAGLEDPDEGTDP
jgi:RecB family exonuclease